MPGIGVALAVNDTSWLIDGCVGENVKFAVCAGSVAETDIVREELDEARVSLVAVNVIVNVPLRVYRWVIDRPVPVCPSPKSHAKVPLLTVDEDALKLTSWLIVGLVGENVKRAMV